MKAQGTPGGFALGHASGDGNGWVHWCLWSHGGNIVDKNDKVIINSPETAKALEYAKAALRQHDPGHRGLERRVQQQGVPGRRNPLDQQRHLDLRRGAERCARSRSPRTWTTPTSRSAPVGKPTELHLMYPVLAMTYTKYPQACKALMAFMLEADNFNPWIESAQGYLTHCLNAYDKNPVWTADPKRTPFRDVAKRTLHRGRARLGRREGGDRDRRLRRARHVRQLLHRPRGREGLDRDRRAAVEADLSLA